MTNTPPVSPPDTRTMQPPTWLERAVGAWGDSARPSAIIMVAAGVLYGCLQKDVGTISASGAVLGVIYLGKAAEVAATAVQTQKVQVAQAQAGTTP